jgi:alpha-ketoglutarate-dependent taurine dioxygenase
VINAGKVHVRADGSTHRKGSWKYHTDDSYTALPGRFTCLHPHVLPQSGGGDTGFIDMRHALRTLPAEEQARLRGLQGIHHFNNRGLFTDIIGQEAASEPGDALADAAHGLVRAVPETGAEALYINLNRMKGVRLAEGAEGGGGGGAREGGTERSPMPTAEAVPLLRGLQAHAERSCTEYRHSWRPGDVLVWDNAQVAHRVHNDWPMGEPRRMIRLMTR